MATVLQGDAIEMMRTLPDESVQTVVTSPPYWGLRDYGCDGQIGLESTLEEYVAALVAVFTQARRALRGDGTLWLNLGDSYAGSWGAMSHDLEGFAKRAGSNERPPSSYPQAGLKPKDLCGVPWRVAFALQADGWYLRGDIIWAKPNPMPESVTDRPTRSHEFIFLLSKSERYFYDADAIREPHTALGRKPGNKSRAYFDAAPRSRNSKERPDLEHSFHPDGRNKRDVWTIATRPYPEAHFAVFPEALIEPCILAGSKPGDTVLDPFAGSGTTLRVAERLQREAIGIELNPAYVELIHKRLHNNPLQMVF